MPTSGLVEVGAITNHRPGGQEQQAGEGPEHPVNKQEGAREETILFLCLSSDFLQVAPLDDTNRL